MKKIELIKDFKPRLYQQSIFANSLNKNTLVVLPTGLGKTVIAIMLCVFYFNSNNKKVLFLAPTKPLVEQQEKSFKSFFKNESDFNFSVLTGLVSPKKRKIIYEESDFIFSTPQLIENDIINSVIKISDFGFVIFDEGHRASGNYAYCFIAEEFDKKKVKILTLTASPGTSLEQIREVMTNLRIEHVQVKKHTDSDVKPYVKKTKIEKIEVELSEEFIDISKLLKLVLEKKFNSLKEMGIFIGKNYSQLTKTDLLDLQRDLRTKISNGEMGDEDWKAISIAAGLMKLMYGVELFESQEVSTAYTYFNNFFRAGGDSSKAAEELTLDINFRDAFGKISKLNKNGIKHPKLKKLEELVFNSINKNKDLRIIIFAQYRESAQKIVEELTKVKEIRPHVFVGQAKKGDVKMTQKIQKQVLDDFRNGEINVLVSTSVGEEGLDIPKVDQVIFYEPVASAIRSIQRIGRTGRFNEGIAYIMQTKGTRDIVTSHIANAKERKMYKSLDSLKSEFEKIQKEQKNSLDKFLGEKNEKKSVTVSNRFKTGEKNEENQSKIEVENDDRILIYVDNRENNDLIKELYRLEEIKVESKKLEVADIVISENIAIERKAKIDFVNSIIDKRLFSQLKDLATNYRRPILILEGRENLFSLRNINPNVIRATLSSIAIDFRIPIIFTDSIIETTQMIRTITLRTKRDKKEISLVANKSSHSENEELEKFISSIPKINVVNAKGLLKHFKSIKELVNTTQKKLLDCSGIGPGRAKFIYEFFRREYKK